jgi:hypothetical protein
MKHLTSEKIAAFLYDEINSYLQNNFSGFTIVNNIRHPTKIPRSENF